MVSKRRDRPYSAGRSPDWVKVKNPKHPSIERVRRRSRKPGCQLLEHQLGNFGRVFNPQSANRNDLLRDKLRDRVATILQT